MQSSYHITFTANVRWALHAIHMKVTLPFDDFSIEPPAIFPSPMYNIPGVTPLTVRIEGMHTKFSVLTNAFSGRFCSACAIS